MRQTHVPFAVACSIMGVSVWLTGLVCNRPYWAAAAALTAAVAAGCCVVKMRARSRLALLIAAADGGHAASQFVLGNMHLNGDRVAADVDRGVRYLKMAAEQGHADSQCALGCMYCMGGRAVQYGGALRYFNLAAAQGHTDALYFLGDLLLGSSTPNIVQAVACFQKAAAQGHAQAQYVLSFPHCFFVTFCSGTRWAFGTRRGMELRAMTCGLWSTSRWLRSRGMRGQHRASVACWRKHVVGSALLFV